MRARARRVMPGFSLSLGITLLGLTAIVLVPLGALSVKASEVGWSGFRRILSDPRILAAFRTSFGSAFIAALIDAPFGVIVAWVLARYRFPGRAILDALVDLPLALPTAIAGVALTAIYAPNGWVGRLLAPMGIRVAFAPAGIVVAMVFVGLPFTVRAVEPILEALDAETEEVAAVLGASRWTTIRRVVLPAIAPAALTGAALSFARALGEYGSIIFISGNMPMKTEIAPLLIVAHLEEYDYAGATAIAVAMLAASLAILVAVDVAHGWTRRRFGAVR